MNTEQQHREAIWKCMGFPDHSPTNYIVIGETQKARFIRKTLLVSLAVNLLLAISVLLCLYIF